jgi:hypothetical protein
VCESKFPKNKMDNISQTKGCVRGKTPNFETKSKKGTQERRQGTGKERTLERDTVSLLLPPETSDFSVR